MSFGALFLLVEDGAHGEFAFECAKGGLGFGQLDVAFPELFRIGGSEVGAQQIGAFAHLLPGAALWTHLPLHGEFSVRLDHAQFIEVGDLGMARLDSAQLSLDLAAVAQLARGHALLECGERLLHARGKAAADGLLFFLARGRATEDVSLFSARRRHQLDIHIFTHPLPVLGEQFALELSELAARRAYQILSAAPATVRLWKSG